VKERRGPTGHAGTTTPLAAVLTPDRFAWGREREERIGVIYHTPFLHGPRATYESPVGDKFHYYNDIRRPHLAI
jgi:hypothetical protein